MINEFEQDRDNWDCAFGSCVQSKTVERTPAFGDDSPVPDVRIGDVVRCVAAVNGDNDGPDWVGVFEMPGGVYLTIEAGCDFTGWDCRSGATYTWCVDERDAFLFGLTEEARGRLGWVDEA